MRLCLTSSFSNCQTPEFLKNCYSDGPSHTIHWSLNSTWGKDIGSKHSDASPKTTVLVFNTFEKGLKCADAFVHGLIPFDTGDHAKR